MITIDIKKLSLAGALGVALFGAGFSERLQAQVDLEAATYGSDSPMAGAAPVSGVTSTLGPITVNQIYTNSTSTYTYNFVSDASGVFNYIYIPISGSSPDPLVVGGTYSGLSLTASPFGTPTNLELTVASTNSPSALVPTSLGATPAYFSVPEGNLTTTSSISDNFTTTPPLDIEPVQFTFTASTTTTVTAVTGNATLTDANNGDKINFYRPTLGLAFTAGDTYTIDGFAFAYSTGAEIYDPEMVVPEPSGYVLMGAGALALVFVVRRTRSAKLA
jgi:hypothetical protein